MNTFIIIYAIGCLFTFLFCKISRWAAKANNETDKWTTVKLTLTSWIGFIFMVSIAIQVVKDYKQSKKE